MRNRKSNTLKKIVVIQRFFPNFREGLFDRLSVDSDLHLICSNKSWGKIFAPDSLERKRYWIRVPYLHIREFVFFPFIFFSLIRINPETIVTEGGSNTINNIQILLYSLIFRKNFILWDLGKSHISENHNLFRKIYLKAYFFIAKRAHKIFTYNTTGKIYFKKNMSKKVDVIIVPNTIDTEKIEKISKKKLTKDLFLEEIEQRGFNRIFLYVGSLDQHKSLEKFKEILDSTKSLNVALIIVGSGPDDYIKSLKLQLREHESNIFFVGRKELDALPGYYAISDFLVLPGLGGLAIHQSMAFGCPVIAFAADGSERDLIIDGVNGFVLERPEDAANIVSEIDRKKIEEMRSNCRKFIFDRFSIINYAKIFMDNLS